MCFRENYLLQISIVDTKLMGSIIGLLNYYLVVGSDSKVPARQPELIVIK